MLQSIDYYTEICCIIHCAALIKGGLDYFQWGRTGSWIFTRVLEGSTEVHGIKAFQNEMKSLDTHQQASLVQLCTVSLGSG